MCDVFDTVGSEEEDYEDFVIVIKKQQKKTAVKQNTADRRSDRTKINGTGENRAASNGQVRFKVRFGTNGHFSTAETSNVYTNWPSSAPPAVPTVTYDQLNFQIILRSTETPK